MRRVSNIVALLWQIPFTVLSYCFYRVVRFLFQNVLARFTQMFPEESKEGHLIRWSGYTEVLRQPNAVIYVMVTSPRWNCHVVIGAVGPFSVKSSISIEVEAAQMSAGQWTFVIYKKDRQTNVFLPSTAAGGKSWQTVKLEPGVYSIIARYYNCREKVTFPRVKVDDIEKSKPRTMTREVADYQNLLEKYRNRRSLFFYLMHYHVFHVLRWKNWLPEPFVLRVYLPTWNPASHYFYGSLRKGEILSVDFDREISDNVNLFLTVCNICSFPVLWGPVLESGYRSEPVPCDGTYLIRVQGKSEGKFTVEKKMIRCTVLPASAGSRREPGFAENI